MNNTQKIKAINNFLIDRGLSLSIKKAPKSINKSVLKFDCVVVFSGSNIKHDLERLYQMHLSSFVNDKGITENRLLNALSQKNFI